MLGMRGIVAGYLLAAVAAAAVPESAGSLAAVLVFWLGGSFLALALALADYLRAPEDEARAESSSDGGQDRSQEMPRDPFMDAA